MTIVQLPNGDSGHKPTPITSTDILIIGTGPAGASLACFLAYYGIFNMMSTVKI
jgi:alkyl hydroperoxide reductase subunit AhpF